MFNVNGVYNLNYYSGKFLIGVGVIVIIITIIMPCYIVLVVDLLQNLLLLKYDVFGVTVPQYIYNFFRQSFYNIQNKIFFASC